MTLLFYDCETTGLPLWREPSELPEQPHIVQLAAILTDDHGKDLDTFERIVRPDGWTIPEETVDLHGITTERALSQGVPETEVIDGFLSLMERATTRVAHNDNFDARIIRIQLKRYGWTEDVIQDWKDFPRYCTQRESRALCKIPPTNKMMYAGRKHFKVPSLEEAYQHFFGDVHDNQHQAMADALAVKRVYFAIAKAKAGRGAA